MWFSATAEICVELEISDALHLNVGLWPVTRGFVATLVILLWRGESQHLPEVVSCKVAWPWLISNHELQAYVCSDFSRSASVFSAARDLHPGKPHSTTVISLLMEAFAFSTAVPKIPHRGVPVASPRNTTITNLSPKKAQAWLWNQELGRKHVNCTYCSSLTSLIPWIFYLC